MKRAAVLLVGAVVAMLLAVALCGCASNDYTPEKRDPQVSENALHEPGKLRVGVDASKAPYAAESSGAIVGINVDVAAAIASELGLSLEIVDVGSDVDAAFANEDVDIVMGVTENDNLWLSDKYLSSAVTLFAQDASVAAPTESDVFTVAAQSSSMSAWQVQTLFGDTHLQATADLPSAFAALNDGTAKYVASDSVIGQYVVHSTNSSAAPIALLQKPSDYHVAVAKDNTELQTGITSALQSINNGGTVNVIMSKWLGSNPDVSSLPMLSAFSKTEESGD